MLTKKRQLKPNISAIRVGRDLGAGSGGNLAGASKTFTGSALGNFSSSNKLTSANGQLVNFVPGTTLWLVLQTIGNTAATTETILSCSSASKGFLIVRAGAASGGTLKGKLFINTPSGFLILGTPGDFGITVMCLTWNAGTNNMFASINGSNKTLLGSLASTAPDSGCSTAIGGPVVTFTTTVALTDARILAMAVWSKEASSTESQTNTYTAGNRFALSSAVTGDVSTTFDFNALRDWNGVASTITTKGSSPLTLSVAGSPTLTKVDEIRVPTSNRNYFDGKITLTTTDANGITSTIRNSHSRVKCSTDALYISAEAYDTNTNNNQNIRMGAYVNGVWNSETSLANLFNLPLTYDIQTGAGTGKVVEVWDAAEILVGANAASYVREGTTSLAVRLPVYLVNGSTSANSSMVLPTAPQKRLVLLGDSILTGFWVSVFSQLSQTALLRADYPTTGTGGVTCHSAGNDSVAYLTLNLASYISTLTAELDGTVSNTLWIQLGTNDYGTAVVLATFQANYAAMLDAIHAASPATTIICQSPIQRIAPSTEAANAVGATLGDYRTAISTVVSTRTSFCTYVNGAAGAIVSNANMFSDGIHITDAGAAQYKAFIKSTLNY